MEDKTLVDVFIHEFLVAVDGFEDIPADIFGHDHRVEAEDFIPTDEGFFVLLDCAFDIGDIDEFVGFVDHASCVDHDLLLFGQGSGFPVGVIDLVSQGVGRLGVLFGCTELDGQFESFDLLVAR